TTSGGRASIASSSAATSCPVRCRAKRSTACWTWACRPISSAATASWPRSPKAQGRRSACPKPHATESRRRWRVRARHRDVVRWSGESLTPEQSEAIAAWPRTVLLRIPPLGDVLFCHATPRNENEIFTKLTREERLLEIFRGLDVTMVVCGHTHMQFDIVAGGVRVVNAGSVGMPFGAPGADWLLLGPGIDLRHTDYDLEAAAGRIRLTRYPK